MINVKIPSELPDCELISILAEKVSQRTDIDFDFFGELNRFRQRVSGEVGRINELFPEYTPHDEQYHIKRLFHVADTVLDRELMGHMNSAELFVLACGLYGHDWGMAVSQDEKDYIISGKLAKGKKADKLWILTNEHDRFVEFTKNWQVKVDSEGNAKEMHVENWREYVRQMHAFRSAARVKRYFTNIDGGVADSVARICAGHWLSFEELRDYNKYPSDFSVLREVVNLRALAVYVRLIDMLDLAEDRTPYVIWKFVAPRDSKSRMEWAKHRALRPVTCPPYQNGRIILVDGSTNDNEVYAALEDLRNWCEEQFKGCNDLLAQMNDPNHKLDIYHIQWRVAAQEFEPISIRFEFDRERMFEVLSEEIYQDDPYVFLRELLQNSIDAIRLRREVLKRKGIEPKEFGVIKVDVKHGEGSNAVVTWQDDGIGMDEYVVKNYLAMAGKSYYQSEDFKREGLEMDPISRFGVGILSCFMVADRVEIETFRDPYFGTRSDALKISIPTVKKQFRIEKRGSENVFPGTTVKVFVENRKLPVEEGQDGPKPLDVTEYISIVAGFVEFPIVIKEGDNKTIILHPRGDKEKALQSFGSDFKVKQLDLSYPLAEVILPQDISLARECLKKKRCDIVSDLGLDGYDGILTYLVPVEDDIDFEGESTCESKLISGGSIEWNERKLRWNDDWAGYVGGTPAGISRSSSHPVRYSVYRDGILFAMLESKNYPHFGWFYGRECLPPPRLVVNIPKARTPKVDLARTQVVGQREKWFKPIKKAHIRYICKSSANKLSKLEPIERMYKIARLMTFNKIIYEDIKEVFPKEKWPIILAGSGGKIFGMEFSDVRSDTVYLCPEIFGYDIYNLLKFGFMNLEDYHGLFTSWKGENFVPSVEVSGYIGSSAVSRISYICKDILCETHRVGSVRFLIAPWQGDPPLLQTVLIPMKQAEMSIDVESVLQKMAEDPTMVDPVEKKLLFREISVNWKSYLIPSVQYIQIPMFVEFEPPFERYFAYAWRAFNIKHFAGQFLLKSVAHLLLSSIQKKLTGEQLGRLFDAFKSISFNSGESYSYGNPGDIWEKNTKKLSYFYELCSEMKLFHVGEIEEVIPSPKEFIPGSIEFDSESRDLVKKLSKRFLDTTDNRPFGMTLI